MTKNIDENDVIQQLGALPNEVPATDNWASLKAAIEAADAAAGNAVDMKPSLIVDSNVVDLEQKRATSHWWKTITSIAAVLMVALVGLQFMSSPLAQVTLDKSYQLTVASLEQGNGAYYQQLEGLSKAHAVQAKSVLSALQDVRSAKDKYQMALLKAPTDAKLQKKVITTLQKERKILRSLMV